jgi:RimJ/RimL family protein N-acetyltransferase
MQGIEIESSEYYLRSLSALDNLNNYLFWMSNPSNNKFIISSKMNYTFSELLEFIENCNESNEVLLLGIFSKSSNIHIGNIKYDNINILSKKATMGILIGDIKYRGKGVAKEVIEVTVSWLNENFGIENFLLGVDQNNDSALKLYTKLGFKEIGKIEPNGIKMLLDIKNYSEA